MQPTPSTDVSVLNRRSGSLTNDYAPGYSVFDNKEAEDIDRLKSQNEVEIGKSTRRVRCQRQVSVPTSL